MSEDEKVTAWQIWGIPPPKPKVCKRCGRQIENAHPRADSLKWCRDCAAELKKERNREYMRTYVKRRKRPPTDQEKADMIRAALRKLGL